MRITCAGVPATRTFRARTSLVTALAGNDPLRVATLTPGQMIALAGQSNIAADRNRLAKFLGAVAIRF